MTYIVYGAAICASAILLPIVLAVLLRIAIDRSQSKRKASLARVIDIRDARSSNGVAAQSRPNNPPTAMANVGPDARVSSSAIVDSAARAEKLSAKASSSAQS